jgi:hypothetical protein
VMMRLAKSIATVSTALTLAIVVAASAHAQAPAAKPAATPAKPAAAAPKTTAAMRPSPAKPATAKAAAPKPAATMKPVAAKPAPAKSALAAVAQTTPAPPPGATASPDQSPVTEPTGAKRDPFVSLVNDRKESGGPALPPGKAGLVVATVQVDGTVKSGAELLAVVSNPERHVYFVREGDQLYDGTVEKIDLDGVTFHENSKDAFGKPVVREVTKRIYASVGEQQ